MYNPVPAPPNLPYQPQVNMQPPPPQQPFQGHDLVGQRSEAIMNQIETFRKFQQNGQINGQLNGQLNGGGIGQQYAAMQMQNFGDLGFNGYGGQIKNMYIEDLDDAEYARQIKKTLSVLDRTLSEEEKEVELRSMLGADFEELKDDIYKQSIPPDNGLIPHKNRGNPLNIQCEEDEQFSFDDKIVDQLLGLGMATRNACMRAVLATDSKGVNQAAEWLLNHQNDDGIDHQVDVL